jgi:hypothetical protein
VNDEPNGGLCDTVLARQSSLRDTTGGVLSADADNVCGCKNCRYAFFAVEVSSARTAFSASICYVVGVRPKKEMFRITAGRIVATMANDKTLGYWAVGKLESVTMCFV